MPAVQSGRRPGTDRAALATIAARCVMVAAGLVSSVVTARFLQPAGRGEYFVAITSAQMLAQLASLGLASSNTYFAARDRTLFTALWGNSLWLSFAGVPVLGLCLIATTLGLGLQGISGTTMAFGMVLAPLILVNLLGSNLLVGLGELGTFNVLQVTSVAIVLPFMLAAGYQQSGPTGFLAAAVLGWSVTAGLLLVRLRRHAVGPLRLRPDVFKTTFSYSLKSYLVTLAGFLVLRINVFMLNGQGGSEQVGYYSVASQIADTLAIIPQSVALVLFPHLISQPQHRGRITVQHALATAATVGVVCSIAWFLAAPVINIAFGPRFEPAVPVVRAMLPGVLFVGVTTIVSQFLAAGGLPVSVVLAWAGGLVVTMVGGHLLVEPFGAVGAATALSVTYALMLVVLTGLALRLRPPLADASSQVRSQTLQDATQPGSGARSGGSGPPGIDAITLGQP